MPKYMEYRLSSSKDGSKPILVNQDGQVLANTKSITVNWSHEDVTEVTVTMFVGRGGEWPDGRA